MNRIIIIAAIYVFLAFGFGCGTARKTVQPEPSEVLSPPDFQVPAGAMNDASASFDMLTYSAQITIGMGGTENSVNGTFRIRKDSMVWVSARKFGFEIGRLMVSVDSVWVLDRINNQYFAGDYLFFSRQFNLDIDYNMIEALLLGNPLANWSEEPVQNDCTRPELCMITYPQRYRVNQGMDGRMRPEGSTVTRQEIAVSRETGRILSNRIEVTDSRRRITAVYDQFIAVGEMLLPQKASIVVHDQGVETALEIQAESYKTNEAPAFPFNIPRSYKPININ